MLHTKYEYTTGNMPYPYNLVLVKLKKDRFSPCFVNLHNDQHTLSKSNFGSFMAPYVSLIVITLGFISCTLSNGTYILFLILSYWYSKQPKIHCQYSEIIQSKLKFGKYLKKKCSSKHHLKLSFNCFAKSRLIFKYERLRWQLQG